MKKKGEVLMAIAILLGVGVGAYGIVVHPELTNSQLLREFWSLYVIVMLLAAAGMLLQSDKGGQ